MTTRLIQTSLVSLGIASAALIAPLSGESMTAQAQTAPAAQNELGDLSEYSPATAPVLTRANTGPIVADVQALLQELGYYDGAIDGVYGPNTVSSVITFQRSRNLSPDGVVGQSTWEALIDAENITAPAPAVDITQYSPYTAPILTRGTTGPVVEDVQAFLKQQGFYDGAIDGVYGSSTAAAVEALQQRYGALNSDGVVGPQTWSVMIDLAS